MIQSKTYKKGLGKAPLFWLEGFDPTIFTQASLTYSLKRPRSHVDRLRERSRAEWGTDDLLSKIGNLTGVWLAASRAEGQCPSFPNHSRIERNSQAHPLDRRASRQDGWPSNRSPVPIRRTALPRRTPLILTVAAGVMSDEAFATMNINELR